MGLVEMNESIAAGIPIGVSPLHVIEGLSTPSGDYSVDPDLKRGADLASTWEAMKDAKIKAHNVELDLHAGKVRFKDLNANG